VTPEVAIFWTLAALTVGSATVVVLARSLIYSAFALLFTFLGVAGLYLLLGADFLATTQLLVYVGGILVLLLFGVMLTHKLYDLELRSEVTQFAPGIVIPLRPFFGSMGVAPPPEAGNAFDGARWELGRQLFFERELGLPPDEASDIIALLRRDGLVTESCGMVGVA
jgi:TM2 domain-containing membrane protein YozV